STCWSRRSRWAASAHRPRWPRWWPGSPPTSAPSPPEPCTTSPADVQPIDMGWCGELDRSSALDDADQHHDHGDDQQDVDEAAEGIRAHHAERPEDEQYYEDRPQHRVSSQGVDVTSRGSAVSVPGPPSETIVSAAGGERVAEDGDLGVRLR